MNRSECLHIQGNQSSGFKLKRWSSLLAAGGLAILLGLVMVSFSAAARPLARQVQPENGSRLYLPMLSTSKPLFPMTPKPSSIQVSLDTQKTASLVATQDGDSLTVSSSDGSLFTLHIPPNAFSETVIIHMTPISEVIGLPGGAAFINGVQITPENMPMLQAGSLVYTPSITATAQVTRALTLGYHENGQDLFLIPMMMSTTVNAFPLTSLGGFIYAQGQPAQAGQPVLLKDWPGVPSRPASQLWQQLYPWTASKRLALVLGRPIDSGYLSQVNNILDEFDHFALRSIPATVGKRANSLDAPDYYNCDSLFQDVNSVAISTFVHSKFSPESGAAAKAAFQKKYSGLLQECWDRQKTPCMNWDLPQLQRAIGLRRVAEILEMPNLKDFEIAKLSPCSKAKWVGYVQISASGKSEDDLGSMFGPDIRKEKYKYEVTYIVTGESGLDNEFQLTSKAKYQASYHMDEDAKITMEHLCPNSDTPIKVTTITTNKVETSGEDQYNNITTSYLTIFSTGQYRLSIQPINVMVQGSYSNKSHTPAYCDIPAEDEPNEHGAMIKEIMSKRAKYDFQGNTNPFYPTIIEGGYSEDLIGGDWGTGNLTATTHWELYFNP